MTSRPARSRTRKPSSRDGAPSTNALSHSDRLATTFKMLGNANRLRIVVFLAERERSVSDIEAALQIRQPTLSQQLGELRDAGLILGRRVAKTAIYALTDNLGRRALKTIYLATGHNAARVERVAPREVSALQAAEFATVLTTRGSQTLDHRFGFKSLLQE